MGRHRRSAAGRAATDRATGTQQADGAPHGGPDPLHPRAGGRPAMGIAPYLNPEAYAEARATSDAFLFATDDPADDRPRAGRTVAFPSEGFTPDDGPRRAGSHRRRRRGKAVAPVRTGLLGVSAAVAIGTVAVATGVVPGLENYKLGSGAGDQVQSADSPGNTPAEQGGTSGSVDSGRPGDASTSPGAGRPSAPPSSSPSPSASPPTSTSAAPTEAPTEPGEPEAGRPEKTKPRPSHTATKEPSKPGAPADVSERAVAAAQVLELVNEERAKAGCSPVTADGALDELAEDFSEAMAAQGFFDHTDPSGATPWDRAEKAGIGNLGGENIARGQADAQAVMDAWMDSPGHRANILNCDFKTLGVGVHFGPGGPWWTQNFGY
ncbi:CAP domain-containing protein [Streptomyces sp. NPDC052309]|uniref:CAP domain-containing protein n=1 Tax=Streptomyces sp. NPDC052309 TaxID=3155421 RepID=UPI00343FF4D6